MNNSIHDIGINKGINTGELCDLDDSDDLVQKVRNQFLSQENIIKVNKRLLNLVYSKIKATFKTSDDYHRLTICMQNHAHDRLELIVGTAIKEAACAYSGIFDPDSIDPITKNIIISSSLIRLNTDIVYQLANDVLNNLDQCVNAKRTFENRENNQFGEVLDNLNPIGHSGRNTFPKLEDGLIGIKPRPFDFNSTDVSQFPYFTQTDPNLIGEAWTHIDPNSTENGRLKLW